MPFFPPAWPAITSRAVRHNRYLANQRPTGWSEPLRLTFWGVFVLTHLPHWLRHGGGGHHFRATGGILNKPVPAAPAYAPPQQQCLEYHAASDPEICCDRNPPMLIAGPPMGVEKFHADFQPADMGSQLVRQLAGSNFGHVDRAIDRVFFHLNAFCQTPIRFWMIPMQVKSRFRIRRFFSTIALWQIRTWVRLRADRVRCGGAQAGQDPDRPCRQTHQIILHRPIAKSGAPAGPFSVMLKGL